MKIYKFILPAFVIVVAGACSSSNQAAKEITAIDNSKNQSDTALIAKMSIPNDLKSDSTIEMTFTVYNPTDSTKTFCKWHTPFEPLMSKYLDITANDGTEAAYKGPMAKRIMPPPADSYANIKAKDSLSIKVDLTKGYNIKPGNYTIHYNSGNISGLKLVDSIKVSIN